MNFGNPITVKLPYPEAREKAIEAFEAEGFGAITEIDVKATLKKKLDKEFRDYTILGMCNPPFAYQALKRNIEVGLLMPCNVVVYDNKDGTSTVSPLNIQELMGNVVPDLKDLAESVGAMITRAMNRLTRE